jgi:hypothetical protein
MYHSQATCPAFKDLGVKTIAQHARAILSAQVGERPGAAGAPRMVRTEALRFPSHYARNSLGLILQSSKQRLDQQHIIVLCEVNFSAIGVRFPSTRAIGWKAAVSREKSPLPASAHPA